MEGVNMDPTDKKILEILQKQARISMTELGRLVALTPPAVAERVKRLEEIGVIEGYRAIINPSKLNKNIIAFINMDIPSEKFKAFLDFASKNKYIYECHHTIGRNCIILKVMFSSTTELESFIGEIKRFGNIVTSIVLSSPIDFKPIL